MGTQNAARRRIGRDDPLVAIERIRSLIAFQGISFEAMRLPAAVARRARRPFSKHK
jgi:hypothetical protein